MDLVNCQADSPLRPTDWRWRRALLCHDGWPRPRRGRVDPWVRRAVRFQKASSRYGGDLECPELAAVDPTVLAALRLRTGGDERLRWEVEARLLTDQGVAGAAGRTGLPVGVVEAYATLFFDVAERLECGDWLMAFVFGRWYLEGFSRDEVGLIWKTVAYRFGAFALDALLDTLYGGSAGSRQGPTVAYAPSLAAAFERYIDLMAIPVTASNAPRLIRLDRLAREIDLRAAAGTADAVTRSVRAAFEPLITTLAAGKDPARIDTPQIPDGDAGERRDGNLETLARRSA